MATRIFSRSLLAKLSTTRSYFSPSRLRPLSAALRPIAAAATTRGFATRSTSSSLNDPNPNWSNRPPKETILLDGCDFEHWLVVMEKPEGDPTRDEIIDSYIKTLATVVGSEEEARMKIYSVSTRHYFAFGALVSEELSYKLKELPKVRWVLPDSYLDVKNKDYGGEPFINGQAVPYDPKYHEEWVRNNARAQDRNRRNDRPRNFDRSRNFERRRENMQNRDVQTRGPPPPNMGPQDNMGPPGTNLSPGNFHQHNAPQGNMQSPQASVPQSNFPQYNAPHNNMMPPQANVAQSNFPQHNAPHNNMMPPQANVAQSNFPQNSMQAPQGNATQNNFPQNNYPPRPLGNYPAQNNFAPQQNYPPQNNFASQPGMNIPNPNPNPQNVNNFPHQNNSMPPQYNAARAPTNDFQNREFATNAPEGSPVPNADKQSYGPGSGAPGGRPY